MGTTAPPPTLHRLRQTLAGIDPNLASQGPAPGLAGEECPVALGAPPIDAALGGGLALGALHELVPTAPVHLAAASGFAAALAARASARRGQVSSEVPGQVLWIATDFAAGEGGGPYGPGLDLFGMPSAHLIALRVPRAVDVLWAMEEGLRCRALACVIAELTGDGAAADLTATRRLSLAAHEGACGHGSGFGLLLRHRATPSPSAAATRWQIAAALSRPDGFGGLGPVCFDLSLRKNRRGPSGRWLVTWDHHEYAFDAALPVGVAEAAVDRSDRAPLVRAG
jgi:protein ImuA